MPLYDQCLAKMAHKMSENFIFHNINSAPDQSTPLIAKLFAQSGPNGFYPVMAESPEALSGYNTHQQAFGLVALTFRSFHPFMRPFARVCSCAMYKTSFSILTLPSTLPLFATQNLMHRAFREAG